MAATVQDWHREQLSAMHASLMNTPGFIFPAAWHRLFNAAYASPAESPWPVSIRGRRLVCVIRQWAEDVGNAGLALRLRDDDGWQAEVARLRTLPEGGEAKIGRAPDGTYWRDCITRGTSDYAIAWHLRQRGLPDSPSVIAFTRAAAQGTTCKELPAQATLVSTFIYALEAADGRMWLHDGNPGLEIDASSAYGDKELMLKAYEIGHRHKAWLERVTVRPIVTEHAVHQAAALASRGASDLNTDYEAELRAPSTTVRLWQLYVAKNRPARTDPVVSEVVDKLIGYMRARRRDAHLDPRPPHGFRDKARKVLTAWLRDEALRQKVERATNP